ncbi:protein ecdysoneless [Homalodisca vitripennis]|uniref:protein ecdysoneless n=1 Tax=Homalodisca vitripennis TaxID=197043 RepID=UPI001EEB005F|nr:protein ecdysoneless [Homalodisca vitripennis]
MAFNKSVLENVREDDFVEYFIFPSLEVDFDNVKDHLQKVLISVKSVLETFCHSYIWQKDDVRFIPRIDPGLNLPPIDDSDEKLHLPPHLYGVSHYGDNIEDEWFIVFLLLEATRAIPDLVVRVVDSDGEFLLIEAANHLPSWATPEACDRRVYLYQGAVHLVPGQEKMTVDEAVKMIRSQPDRTRASEAIQTAINARIEGYPQRISENLHSCNVVVPVRVAALLKARPSLVAPAVTAFCHRDPIDLKVCRAMRYFPPEQCATVRVTFTKCLYAMLTHQKYVPDRRTGWKLPPPTDPTYAAKLLGVKLACGFEILVSQSKNCGKADELNKDWQIYKKSLAEKGYFKDLLEGSQEYVKLEQTAKEYFQSHCTQSQPPTGQVILDILQDMELDVEEMQRNEASLPPPDDDSWLEVTPPELDRMMEQRYGCRPSHTSGDISARLADFLSHVSSLDGAEFPQDDGVSEAPVRPRRGIKAKKKAVPAEKDNEDDNRVSFDHEAFSCAVQNILDFVVPEDNWDMESDGSGMSSYEDEEDMDLGGKTGDQAETPVSELKQYMDQMDRELSSTAVGKSFQKIQTSNKKEMEDSFSEVENFEPVDIDLNALKNILESYQSQMGGAGPASNMLGPMGVRLDKP